MLDLRYRFQLSHLEFPQPSQGTQPRQKAILAAPGDNESRQSLKAQADWALGDVKHASTVTRSGERVSLVVSSEEATVVHPFRLNEFELASQVGSNEGEHQSSIYAVIFKHSIRKQRSVRGSATYHPVNANHACHVRIPWVHPTDMRPVGGLIAYWIVFLKEEGVVAVRVGPKFRIIMQGT
jgi:hypothetical protein